MFSNEFFNQLQKQMIKEYGDERTDRDQVGEDNSLHPQGNHHDGGLDDSRLGGRDMRMVSEVLK